MAKAEFSVPLYSSVSHDMIAVLLKSNMLLIWFLLVSMLKTFALLNILLIPNF